jgi:hypothetical protein
MKAAPTPEEIIAKLEYAKERALELKQPDIARQAEAAMARVSAPAPGAAPPSLPSPEEVTEMLLELKRTALAAGGPKAERFAAMIDDEIAELRNLQN